MEKQWKSFGDECTRCGSEAEVLTGSKEEGSAYDGDDCRCSECGLTGSVSVGDCDEDSMNYSTYVSWDDFEDDEEVSND